MRQLLTITLVMFSVGASLAQVPSYVPTSGLIGWYPFNGNANDESGNALHGTVNGAVLTTDRFGNSNSAYNFNGTTDNISIADNAIFDFESNNTFSISCWVYTTNEYGISKVVHSKQNGSGTTQNGWYGALNGYDQVTMRVMNGIGTEDCHFNTSSGAGDYANFHFVWTFDGTQISIYMQGTLQSQTACNADVGNNAQDLLIGLPNWSSPEVMGYEGVIDDVGIWNTALTLQDAIDLYNGANVGINETNIDKVEIYPNPSNEAFNLVMGDLVGLVFYNVFDAVGRNVSQGSFNSSGGHIETINLNDITKGVYTLRMQTPNAIIAKRLIKE